MKKIITILIMTLMLFGCSSVIYEEDEVLSESYKQVLSFKDSDYDTNYDNATIVVLNNEDVIIDSEGSYILNGTLNDASIIVKAGSEENVRLLLNNLTINSNDFASIYVASANKVTITLAEGSENTLSDSGTYSLIDDNNVDAVIYSKSDLVINGTGKLNIDANYKHAIVSKDDLVIIDGNYKIESKSQAINGKDSVKIANGNFDIKSGSAAIYSNNDEDEGRGYTYIEDGTFNIDSEGDGIKAYNDLYINGGTINITNSVEGLEAADITINGGDISINASDDGINASNKSNSTNVMGFSNTDADVKFNGGNVYINAGGDGIDSNGTIEVNGGSLFVEGPTNDGDAGFDYETSGSVNGGEMLVIGSSGMAESCSESSTQANLLYNLSSTYQKDTKIIIYDANGNVVFEKTSSKQFSSILVSSSSFNVGDTIKIRLNNDEYEYTLESTVNTYGNTFGGFGGGGHGGQNMPSGNFDSNNKPEMSESNENAPEDFDPSNLPDNFDPSNIPEGFDGESMPQMPDNFDSSNMPEGFDSENMPQKPNGGGMRPGNNQAPNMTQGS